MHIRDKVEVAASAERAWEVLGDGFGQFHQWSTALVSSTLKGQLGTGASRVCRVRAFGPFPAAVIEEQLTEFNPDQKRYTYVARSGMPAMFKSAQNTWTIEAIDASHCVIHTHAVVKLSVWMWPLGWLFPLLLKRDFKKFSEEMKFYIEHQKIHPRKAQSLLQPAQS